MKTVKKDAASFKKMDAAQMEKIKGGYYVEIRNADGSVTKVWI